MIDLTGFAENKYYARGIGLTLSVQITEAAEHLSGRKVLPPHPGLADQINAVVAGSFRCRRMVPGIAATTHSSLIHGPSGRLGA